MIKKYNILEKLILQIIKHKVAHWFNLEKTLTANKNFIKADKLSPYKTWPDPEKIPHGGEIPFSLKNFKTIGKFLRSCIKQGEYSITSLADNPVKPENKISSSQLKDFENFAKKLGIKTGYTKIPGKLIFHERAVLYDNAIVLIMEMDKEAVKKAPSLDTFKMVFQTYDELGIATNKLVDYLRKNNFNAQASHPLGGMVLYPPLAKKAGLGWLGKHGLLITPEYGARQRIAAIFTSIENLPFNKTNEHEWVESFCEKCNRCIRTCPAGAILQTPVLHESKRETHIERAKCLPYFVDHQGCSVCLKNCVFSFKDYYSIKAKTLKKIMFTLNNYP